MNTSDPEDNNARKEILSIDDDHDNSVLMRKELVDRGFFVRLARDGLSGLASVLANPPDLVLSDVKLAGISGFEVLKRLRELHPRFERMPFVFLTTLGDRESVMRGWHLGADDYLTKPIDCEVLAALITARLARTERNTGKPAKIGLRIREVETLTWAARGKTFWEIGRILGVSKRTVEFHLDSARRKLGVATRTQALIKAATDNLIQP